MKEAILFSLLVLVIYCIFDNSETKEKEAAQAFCNSQPVTCECKVEVLQGRYVKRYYATYKYGGKWFTKDDF